ncbi:MAG: hypothetical protein R3E01_11245 [Pirellulaceae bacterium]|nr:response regulator transcription factor [Planctomycetales bacterium]
MTEFSQGPSTVEQYPKLPATPWGVLPPRLRVILITSGRRVGSGLADALASDSATRVFLEEATGVVEGLARLRDEVFDVVLLAHDPGELDALELVDAVRASSHEQQPIIVLGEAPECQMLALCFECGADGYVGLGTTSTRTLLWLIARATERRELIDENHRMQRAERQRQQRECEEAESILQQQQRILDTLDGRGYEGLGGNNSEFGREVQRAGEGHRELEVHYGDLLRAYVIMGAGNLTRDIRDLVQQIRQAKLDGEGWLTIHLRVLAGVIRDLGVRSARHVMNRADLLALEVSLHLLRPAQRGQESWDAPSGAWSVSMAAGEKVCEQA